MDDYTTGSTDLVFAVSTGIVYPLSSPFKLANVSQTSYCIHTNTEINAYHTFGIGSIQRPALKRIRYHNKHYDTV